jgi:hypothetical protein
VERGRTFRITRHGKAIARIVPEDDARRTEAADAIERCVRNLAKRRSMKFWPPSTKATNAAFAIDASIVAAFAFGETDDARVLMPIEEIKLTEASET